MNRFIVAAIQNMEKVEYDHDRDRPNPDLRQQWTQEAIAYTLIAIAEAATSNSQPADGPLIPSGLEPR